MSIPGCYRGTVKLLTSPITRVSVYVLSVGGMRTGCSRSPTAVCVRSLVFICRCVESCGLVLASCGT